ncbi:hypothetical protein [Rubinisphaera sp.]|uniref:hypothetical protein n=1 Tax=Rubinisphaera sp. TaxID=2024857 RepID=UPI000C0FA1EC|nr:hypothetical protein [Rubinisphaera sp.]MBV10299.1 hypothetical protein [Rubinisphaera sp.]|tara:strand:+ start:94 stop:507 length:414 start_codon:yes stop_codon:yes gene_type:complete
MTSEFSIASVERGKSILITCMVKLLLLSAILIASYVMRKGLETLPPRIVRFVLTLLLLIWLYRGSLAAKWICVVLYGISGIALLVMMPLDNLWACLILGSMSFVFLEMTYRLLHSRDVNHFLRFQREGGIRPEDGYI